jgi:lipoyl(octanoyl) transferase
VITRALGRVAYEPTWRAMQAFTQARTPATPDQLWRVEHPPVYTLGLAGRREHLLDAGGIPVVSTDRGGQVTYHGPGQALVYVLMDLRRVGYGVRELVRRLEGAVIETLAGYGIPAARREGMPGVYVEGAKIAAIGLRVSRGCTYHGVSLNVDLDLEPFSRIDPCGYPGLASTRLADRGVGDNVDVAGRALAQALERHLVPYPRASHV